MANCLLKNKGKNKKGKIIFNSYTPPSGSGNIDLNLVPNTYYKINNATGQTGINFVTITATPPLTGYIIYNDGTF